MSEYFWKPDEVEIQTDLGNIKNLSDVKLALLINHEVISRTFSGHDVTNPLALMKSSDAVIAARRAMNNYGTGFVDFNHACGVLKNLGMNLTLVVETMAFYQIQRNPG